MVEPFAFEVLLEDGCDEAAARLRRVAGALK
jgi:hypothetical protein